ncbi:MAG: nucleoside 2-deoxyribosyltransferase [Candidatus Saccharimonadales bacterium]
MKKVYFACAIRGGGDTSNYLAIVEAIKAAGAEVISEVFVKDVLLYGGSPLPADQIYARDVKMIQECDLVIVEATNPSLGVGYEIGVAEKLGRPVLCLFDESSDKRLSAMIEGNAYNTIALYRDNTVPSKTIADFINKN